MFKCKVCESTEAPTGFADSDRMLSVGICYECDFWMEKFGIRDEENTARIKGHHYVMANSINLDPDPSESAEDLIKRAKAEADKMTNKNKGNGGRFSVVMKEGGELRFTNDLWCQGEIPERFRELLPDNAVFVG